MKPKLVHLTDRQFEYLEERARAVGIPVSELIRRILDHHIDAGLPDPEVSPTSRIPKRMEPGA